jgi:O-antigen/teichoic acid export membrane protein
MTCPQLAARGTRGEAGRIIHGTAWLTLSTGLEGVLNYAYALLATRLLPVEHYTVFAAGQALLLILGSAAGTAIPWVLARGLARAGGDRWARSQAVRFAVTANLAFGAAAAVLVWIVASTFADSGEAVMLAGGTALLFTSSTVWGYLQGEERFLALGLLRVAEVVGKVTVGVTLMALGFGALGGLAGFGAGSVIVLAVGTWHLRADL